MDLVNSYTSENDDSDIEEINVVSSASNKISKDAAASSASDVPESKEIHQNSTLAIPNMTAPTSEMIDIIDLSSDSEDEVTAPPKIAVQQQSAIPENKSISNSKQDIDVIELVENDGIGVNNSNKELHLKPVSEPPKNKIDYLNLEDNSDTETEVVVNQIDAPALLDSAFALSNVPIGPRKPTTLELRKENISCVDPVSNCNNVRTAPEIFMKNNPDMAKRRTPDLVTRNTPDLVTRNTPDLVTRNTPDLIARNTPDSQIRRTPDIQSTTSCDSTETYISESSRKHLRIDSDVGLNNVNLYREDYRILSENENVFCRIPRQVVQTHKAHANVITSLNWCIKKYGYLFLSASLDGSVKVWDLFGKNFVQCLRAGSGLNDAKWSLDGGQIVAGGQGEKAYLYDVESGQKMVEYGIYNIVTSLEFHPYMEDVFLCGTRNAILGYDIRVNSTLPIRSFFSKCEEVLDLAFIDENQFINSSNVVSSDSADRTIMVWHFGSGAKLSNQVYLERFTCPSIKVHPHDSSFIAQSNGNYIACFSASPPYKIKNKRYMGHKVAGYGIECDISPDGKYVISGDADGGVYFYNYSNTTTVFVVPPTRNIPVNKVKWHPSLSTTVLTSNYDGEINIWR